MIITISNNSFPFSSSMKNDWQNEYDTILNAFLEMIDIINSHSNEIMPYLKKTTGYQNIQYINLYHLMNETFIYKNLEKEDWKEDDELQTSAQFILDNISNLGKTIIQYKNWKAMLTGFFNENNEHHFYTKNPETSYMLDAINDILQKNNQSIEFYVENKIIKIIFTKYQNKRKRTFDNSDYETYKKKCLHHSDNDDSISEYVNQ